MQELGQLAGGRADSVPRFCDRDGRTAAEVLFLLQDPGRSGATKSGVVCRENDDATARAFREANDGVLNREKTISWNAIPWAREGTQAEERRLVRELGMVPKLLDALPEVRVVVLLGNVAREFTVDVYDYGAKNERDLLVLHGPHPSSLGLQGDKYFGREQRKRWLRRVVAQVSDHISQRGGQGAAST